jgi:3-phenylpropionate/cinnamic acid dioxygenase small subunit
VNDRSPGSRAAIAELVYGYAELIDLGRFDEVGSLFADATFRAQTGDTVHVRTGAAEVTAQFTHLVRLLDDGTPGTKHVTTNLIIHVDEEVGTATCHSYFTVLQATPGPAVSVIVAGRYHDSFRRDSEARWRFADRLIFTDLVGDVTGHLRPGVL